jgi:hypothetical protein
MLSAEPPVLVSCTTRVFVGWLADVIFNSPKAKLAGMIFTVPKVSVIVAAPVFVVSVTEVAVTVTLASVGTAGGAAYVPSDAIVPQVGEHAVAGVPWVKVQVTP